MIVDRLLTADTIMNETSVQAMTGADGSTSSKPLAGIDRSAVLLGRVGLQEIQLLWASLSNSGRCAEAVRDVGCAQFGSTPRKCNLGCKQADEGGDHGQFLNRHGARAIS